MDKGFVQRNMALFLEANLAVKIMDQELREKMSAAFAVDLVNDVEFVQKYTDVFLEDNQFVKIGDPELREQMSAGFAHHTVGNWDMIEDAEAELKRRGVSI